MRINYKHGPNCWQIHHDCAINEINRLRALLASSEFRVGADAPDTSKKIEKKVSDGTFQHKMLMLFDQADYAGLTDYELEAILNKSHQSVSATRNTLMRKGFIKDSGVTRLNKYNNQAIVWVLV